MKPRTLYDKLWDSHVAAMDERGIAQLYIDLHLVHEVTSPQAFAGLRAAGRRVRAPHRTLAVADHNVPTTPDRVSVIADPESRLQLDTLSENLPRIWRALHPDHRHPARNRPHHRA